MTSSNANSSKTRDSNKKTGGMDKKPDEKKATSMSTEEATSSLDHQSSAPSSAIASKPKTPPVPAEPKTASGYSQGEVTSGNQTALATPGFGQYPQPMGASLHQQDGQQMTSPLGSIANESEDDDIDSDDSESEVDVHESEDPLK